MTMLEKIWKQIKEPIGRLPFYHDREIGCNICTDDGENFYICDYVVGDEGSVCIPINPTSIGDFHTHIDRYDNHSFSIDDIVSSHRNKLRYIFVSDGIEVYGMDLSRYSRMLSKCRRRLDYKKVTRKINNNLEIFYFEEFSYDNYN